MEHIFACIGKVQAEKNSKRCFFKFYKFSLPSENYPSNYSCLDDLTCDSTYYSETPKFTTADAATNLSIDFPYSVDSKKIVDYSIEPKKENECTQNAFRIDINKEKHGIRSIQPNLAESIKTENNQKPENEGIANGCLAPRNERCSFEDKTVSESPQSIMIFQPKDIELIPSEAEKSYEENEPCQEPISATLIHDDDTEYVLEDKLVKEINDNEAKITEARVMAARKILSIALRKLEEQINNNSMRH
ncbi:hypothetical protein HYD_5330 [Candidatus Hydrogenosomobacter endosymbioticus]|uniref:Uncharacterized protein n=2 Tax=Candidatus Hydrogenosomobacter endosymbioticus TaxID=2558174 RepID=A0ABM7V9D6_9PROT|nr:hypothetical protein HYD_5330 [Candidatus Hydrogenosomobacter endosymbioticus]